MSFDGTTFASLILKREGEPAGNGTADPPGYGDVNTFLRIIFVLLARIGFLLVQIGSIPVQNVYRIIFLNVFEIGNAITLYILIGHMIAHGSNTFKGFFGYSKEIDFPQIDEGIVGICACLLGLAQISCLLIGRIHLIANILTTVLYCGFFQPFLAHWIWNKEGWMRKFTILGTQVSVKDYGGDLVIHLSSCVFGAIGAMFLGRRLMKASDLDERSLAREYSGQTYVGYCFIIFGYVAFNLPSVGYEETKKPSNYIATILLNNTAAFATGVLLTSILQMIILKRIFNYWSVIRIIQGGVAGIISIAAAVDIYTYSASMAVAAITSIFFFFFSILIHNTSLEDNCNVIATYFISSFIGCLVCPIVAKTENFDGGSKGIHILWQLICLGIVLICTLILAWLLFCCLAICKLLRSKEEVANHKRAVQLAKYMPKKSCLQRLFMIDNNTEHIAPGEIQRQKYIQERY